MASLARAASSLLTKATSSTEQENDERKMTAGEKENRDVYTVVISGSHGMVGTFLLELLKDPTIRIDGRRVRCRRLIRTRRFSSQRSRSSTLEASGPPDNGTFSSSSSLPPRPEFLPSPAEAPAHAFQDAAETSGEQRGDEVIVSTSPSVPGAEGLELDGTTGSSAATRALLEADEAATVANDKREAEEEGEQQKLLIEKAEEGSGEGRKSSLEEEGERSSEKPHGNKKTREENTGPEQTKKAAENEGLLLTLEENERRDGEGDRRRSAVEEQKNEKGLSGKGEEQGQIETDDIYWDIPGQWIEADKLEGVDAVLHLAGEPLAEKGEVAGERAVDRASSSRLEEAAAEDFDVSDGEQAVGASSLGTRLKSFIDSEEWLRSLGAWTEKKKKEIIESRTLSTRLLVNTFRNLKKPPAHFFVASGVGYYGIDRGDEVCDENTGAGSTFVAETSIELEREAAAAAPRNSSVFKEFASPAADFDAEEEKEKEETDPEKKRGFAGCRVVFLRFGVIFSTRGGILPRLLPLYKLRFGARLGNGQQWMSWVSLYDAAQAILFLLEKEHTDIEGPVNICSSHPMRNFELASQLHAVLHPRAWLAFTLPVPAFILRLVLGQLANEVLLGGQRVIPRRLELANFAFAHLDIGDALRWSLEDQKLEKEKASLVFPQERQAALLEEWREEEPEALERLNAAAEAVNRQQVELCKQLQESEHLLELRRQEQVLKRHQSKVQQLLQRRETAKDKEFTKEETGDAGTEGDGMKKAETAAF